MLHHVSIGVADVERAAKFYDAVLATLGYRRVMEFLPHAVAYGDAHPTFWVQLPHDQQSASTGNGAHFAFIARSKAAIDAFHAAAIAAGGMDNGTPGPRPDYGPDYYGAFVIDPDGNKIEATLVPEPPKAAARKPAAKKPALKSARKPAKKKAKPAARKPAKKAKRSAKAARKAKRK